MGRNDDEGLGFERYDPYEIYCSIEFIESMVLMKRGMMNIEMIKAIASILGLENPALLYHELSDALLRDKKKETAAVREWLAKKRAVRKNYLAFLDKTIPLVVLGGSIDNIMLDAGTVYRKMIMARLALYKKRLDIDNSIQKKRLEHIREVYGLDEIDYRALLYFYLVAWLDNFELSRINDDFEEDLRVLSYFLKMPAHSALAAKRKLTDTGIIYRDYGKIYISDFILNYLASNNPGEALTSNTLVPFDGNAFPIDTFTVGRSDTELLAALLKTGRTAHILLYGKPGTGKTEYARSLLKLAGKSAVVTRQPEHYTGKHTERITAAANAAGSGRVLVIDEADPVLNTQTLFHENGSNDKAWINEFLDRAKITTIWIVNDISEMEESTMRRFDHSVRFDTFSVKERRNAWKNILDGSPAGKYLDDNDVKAMAGRYRVNASAIVKAVRAAEAFAANRGGRKKAAEAAELSLRQYLKLTGGRLPDSSRLLPVTSRYMPKILNTDPPVKDVVESAVNACRAFDKKTAETGLNIFLYGPPGTGKTEFAKVVAAVCGRGLMVKRFSDLESPFVGMAERNIASAFEEAEKEGLVLFIDEADSMFTDRTSARASWEVSRTNEMLSQMENFKGILICASNLLELLDNAVLRRFAWKVEFKPARRDDRPELYKRYFCKPGSRLCADQLESIKNLEGLTPGDCEAVRRRYQFNGKMNDSHTEIISRLKHEIDLRQGGNIAGIGF